MRMHIFHNGPDVQANGTLSFVRLFLRSHWLVFISLECPLVAWQHYELQHFLMKTSKGFALKRSSIGGKLFEIVLYGMAVISTMLVCLLPFLLTDDPGKQISQILFRLFPFGRGLFEDKGNRAPLSVDH